MIRGYTIVSRADRPMTDIALLWDNARWGADIGVAGGDLTPDDGLRTAIILSLFTNAPAKDDDVLPPGADRQGWWGDAIAQVAGTVTGSRLWLLSREKQLGRVLDRARDYAAEALQWLLDEKVAASLDVQATNPSDGVLAIAVAIVRPSGPDRQVYDFVWEASA